MIKSKKTQKGFAAFFITILIFTVIFGIAISISSLALNEQKIAQNIIKSSQAYYTAEAGIEDALLRLVKGMSYSSPYSLTLGAGTSSIEISDVVGGSRTVTSSGNVNERIRKVRVGITVTDAEVSFIYGVQVGNGGLIMGQDSQIQGNVFSNGTISGGNNAVIMNSAIISGNGNKLDNVDVGENVDVHTCADSDIVGTLRYVSGGSVGNCTYGAAIDRGPNEIEPMPLPISSEQIQEWKTIAAAGGTIDSDLVITGVQSLGPIQIGTLASPSDLIIEIGATLNVTGTIYVTGDIIIRNLAIITLDSGYGSSSGVILSDGVITVNPDVTLSGSGEVGSYVLFLSTKDDAINPVISVLNNAVGGIFYSNEGLIYLANNMVAREITGYRVQIENNAIIQYEVGLADAIFSNGPGGSWMIVGWQEIE